MKQRWKVLLVTSVAVFMGFLDVTIVNIAFPDIERRLPRHVARGALLDPQRLQHRLRRAARPGGPARGPRRPAADVLHRHLDLPRRLRAVRPRAVGRGARGGARRAGGRRRDPGPDLAGAAAPRVPARAARDGDRALGRHGRRGGRDRPGARRRARRRDELALGLLRQPRHRPAGADPRAAAAARGARRAPGPLPDALGVVLLVLGVGLLSLGIVKGQDWGWDSARVVGSLVASALALAGFVAPLGAPSGAGRRAGLLRVRSFAVANAGVVPVRRSASTRCCWRTSCS